MSAHEGASATITFGTSSFTAQATQIGWSGVSREALSTTTLGTTTARTFTPATLYDGGTITVTGQFDAGLAQQVPYSGAAETVTIEVPSSGAGATSTYAASAFVTDFSFTVQEGAIQEYTATLKVSGAITVTP